MKKTIDFNNLRWVDASKSSDFDEGFKSIFMRDNIVLGATNGRFTQVRNFSHPLAFGMRNGNI